MSDDLTKPTPDETGHKALKFLVTLLGSLLPPGASGTAVGLFDLIVTDPAVKRRDRFMMYLAERLDALAEQRLLDPALLLNNDGISAYLLHAIQIAYRSQGEKKLEALREAAARGTIAHNEVDRMPGYVVLGILDRLTDYHIIRLRWEAKPQPSYTAGQIAQGHFETLHYGQPTYSDPGKLKQPVQVFKQEGVRRYVEMQSVRNFNLAYADLVALGLLEPVLREDVYLEGRVERRRVTPEVAGHRISELGKAVVQYTEPVTLHGS